MKSNVFTSKLIEIIAPETFDGPDSYLFLVMDYYKLDMRQFLNEATKLKYDEVDVVRIIYQLLCGINFLHSANLMHRDLKPSNILVDTRINIRICDFGLSRCLLDTENSVEWSETRSQLSDRLIRE